MGVLEMVEKRACPASSRLVPVGRPMGFSGAFSSAGARVFSAHSFSDAEGLRPSNTSRIGDSATFSPAFFFTSAMKTPLEGNRSVYWMCAWGARTKRFPIRGQTTAEGRSWTRFRAENGQKKGKNGRLRG